MAGNLVLCLCCNQRIPRQREREHRKRMVTPTAMNSTHLGKPSQQRRFFPNDEDTTTATGNTTEGPDVSGNTGGALEASVGGIGLGAGTIRPEIILERHWQNRASPVEDTGSDASSDQEPDENTESSTLDDGLDDAYVDWAGLEPDLHSGLSAWDRLGEDYEAEAVGVGE